MASAGCEIVYMKCLNENIRENIKEITTAICALLNSNGGEVALCIESRDKGGKDLLSSQSSSAIRTIEQSMISIIGVNRTVANINFKENELGMVISVKKANCFITTNYNLHLPSQEQMVLVPATDPLEEIMRNIINRKSVQQAVPLRSHEKLFIERETCGIEESKMVQFKCLKSKASKRTTLADRVTGKGNKFTCYVSGFANYNGGHIYYGIKDNGVVEGEFIPVADDRNEITKKVQKAINKMIWPKQVGQPKRGQHWEIFFESVLDVHHKPVPSTFVIVIYIAPCLGGVFTEEPECYEMVEGKVQKMSFATWNKTTLQPLWLQSKDEIPHSVERTKWSSVHHRNVFIRGDKVLMQQIVNGNWHNISKKGKFLENKYPQNPEIKLQVLSKHITARYRRGHFNKAQALLQEYTDILPQAQDLPFFEVLRLYLNAGLKRASGDFVGLKEFLFAALSQAEFIEPGLVTAIIYILAATVTDILPSEDQTENFSPQYLSIRALQHWERVTCSANVLPEVKHKSHLTLATSFLGCNISGQRVKGNEDVRLNEAKKSIMAVHESIYEGNPLSKYSEVQLNLVESIYYYRYSQNAPDHRARYLGEAFDYAKKAESLARDNQFMEMVEWSETHKALYTEELLRTRFSGRQ